MDEMRSSKLSEPELQEMHDAQRLIDQAERRQHKCCRNIWAKVLKVSRCTH